MDYGYLAKTLFFRPSLEKSLSLDSERTKPIVIDLRKIRNAAEVIRFLKLLNENTEKSLERNKKLQGIRIDLDYLGTSNERVELFELMELIQKNLDAKEHHDKTRTRDRMIYISNPEILEEYRRKLRKKHISTSSESDENDRIDPNTSQLLNLLRKIRRDGDLENQNTETNVDGNKGQNAGENLDGNIGQNAEDFHSNVGETVGFGVVSTSAHPASSEVTQTTKEDKNEIKDEHDQKEDSLLRTHDDYNEDSLNENKDYSEPKKHSIDDNKSDQSDKAVTKLKIDTLIKKQKENEEILKSIESYKNSYKKNRNSNEREQSNKKGRWVKEDSYENDRRGKKKDVKRKEETFRRPAARPRVNLKTRDRPSKGNKPLNNRENSNQGFYSYGRTSVPIVGKRGIYEDD